MPCTPEGYYTALRPLTGKAKYAWGARVLSLYLILSLILEQGDHTNIYIHIISRGRPSGHARRTSRKLSQHITYGEVMRSTVLCIALGLSIASAKQDPSFIPADDERVDPSLHYTPVNSVNYHGVLETAGRQPVLMAYLDDSLPNYHELRETYNRAVATFGCLAPDQNYMMPSGINVRARFIVGEDDVTMPSLSIFRRKRRVTFAGNWTEAELRVWVYKELAGLEFVEEDAEYDAFVKSTEKTAVRAGRGGLVIAACTCDPGSVRSAKDRRKR